MGVIQSKRGAKVNVRKFSKTAKDADFISDNTKGKEKSGKNNSKSDVKLQVTTAEKKISKGKHRAEEKPPSRESNKVFWKRFSIKSNDQSKAQSEEAAGIAKQTPDRKGSFLSNEQRQRKNSYTVESEDHGNEEKDSSGNSNLLNFAQISDSNFVLTEDEVVDVHQVYNYINDGSLKPHLCDPTYLLILDTRETEDYNKSHLISARHSEIVYSGYFSLAAFNYGFLGTQTNLNEFAIIIVYGNKIDLNNIDPESPEIKLFKELKSYDVDPSILVDGYEGFYSQYPFLCSDTVPIPDNKSSPVKTYPSTILPNQLYQGRGNQATNQEIVKNLQITHIVNISNEHQNAFTDFIKYLSINIEDVSTSKIIEKLPQSTNFITNALEEGGRVIVHCHLGVSRSSTITIAYLMKSKQWSLKKAHGFLREQRTCIRPNIGFLKQLSEWEETLFGKN